MNRRRQLGQRGEQAAANYLQKSGWRLLAYNYRIGHKEIDLIAYKDKRITLFEVKTRRDGDIFNIITNKQRETLRRVHAAFCNKHQLKASTVDYSLIIINPGTKKTGLIYYRNFLE